MESAVAAKLCRYAKNDLARLGVVSEFKIADAVQMVRDTNGVCPDCGVKLLLSGWVKCDPRQFSFDRIADHKPHSTDNCRVTCLGCNFNKADTTYQPTVNFKYYDEIKKQYFKLKAYYVTLDDDSASEATKKVVAMMFNDLRRIETTLYRLHPTAFDGNVRPNKWRRYSAGVGSEDDPAQCAAAVRRIVARYNI